MAPALPFFVLAVVLVLQDVLGRPRRRPAAPADRPRRGVPVRRPRRGDVRLLLPGAHRSAAVAPGVAAADVVPLLVLSGAPYGGGTRADEGDDDDRGPGPAGRAHRGRRRHLADHPGPPGDRQRRHPGAGRRARRGVHRATGADPRRPAAGATGRASASAATSAPSPMPPTRAPSSGSWPTTGTRWSGWCSTAPSRWWPACRARSPGPGSGCSAPCDVVVCARTTKIRPAYGAIGFSPDGGTSWALARALGAPRALDLMLTNGSLTAAEAHLTGLVARLVEDEDLGATTEQVARGDRRRPGPGDGAHPRAGPPRRDPHARGAAGRRGAARSPSPPPTPRAGRASGRSSRSARRTSATPAEAQLLRRASTSAPTARSATDDDGEDDQPGAAPHAPDPVGEEPEPDRGGDRPGDPAEPVGTCAVRGGLASRRLLRNCERRRGGGPDGVGWVVL